ncbi:MAG: diguanylate cyclase [Gammaproteobacteria bacterium]|nr:diguanylate cyclase [Gammaproteobacteria bacterium]MCK5262617.1 diguanylate cyclase [Gammaproteobacteria bacterium]
MKVLVLEHSRLFQKMLTELLEELDCEVDCVRSGTEGKAKLEKESYSLILAGQHIFDESGADFATYCSSKQVSCPIILLTSEPNETLLKNARNAGITDIFPKSNFTYLRESLRYYIEGQTNIDVKGGRVIYIEDSRSVAHVVINYLKKINLDVTHFTNAETALKSIISEDYDLVITDVILDGTMSGTSLVRMIRAQNSHISEIPILAMTGHDDPQRRIELYHAGINDYVTKPPIEEELASRVYNLITNKRLLDQVREQQKSLYDMAMKDQLTSCHNRHSLAEYAPKYIHDAIKYNFPLSMMILDLDHFKEINDQHGHTTGDVVLSSIGELLMASCKQGDFVARIGGEEFAIMLPHYSASEAMAKSEEIRAMIELRKPNGLKITASIGVATLSDIHNENYDALYKDADQAVYLSKENGRNCITLYSDEAVEKTAANII